MTGRHRSLTDVEFNATREVFHFKTKLLDLLADHFGGQSTLNHLRVGSLHWTALTVRESAYQQR
jgi:hypothetical protein